MTDMLKGGRNDHFHGPFTPSAVMRQSFRQLKAEFTSAPVLVHFNLAKRIRLETDASGYAIASIILQQAREAREAKDGPSDRTGRGIGCATERAAERTAKGHWHPVAFWSRSMSPAEQNYTVGDQEMLAIIMSCRHWQHYLEGIRHPVEVLTDYHNLQRFMTTKSLTGQ
jgi:hypothetical protein